MSSESSIYILEVLEQWRADLLASGDLTEPDFSKRAVGKLAEALTSAEPQNALNQLGKKVIERLGEARAFVEHEARGGQLKLNGRDVDLRPLDLPGENVPHRATERAATAKVSSTLGGELPGDWAAYEGEPPPARNNLSVDIENGRARLTWRRPQEEGEVCLYRVTTNDEYMPFSPEAGAVFATREMYCDVEMPVLTALQFVQVWVHVGDSEEAASTAEPLPLADTILVSQPQHVEIREDQGDVHCRWNLPHTAGDYGPLAFVHVQRFPQQKSGSAPRNSGHDIPAELSGFQDSTADAGGDYDYRVEITAELPDGRRVTSSPVTASVSVSAVHQAVTDLACVPAQEDASGPTFQAVWSNPSVGVVKIYRTQEEIPGGYAFKEMDMSEVFEALDPESELPNPVVTDRETGQQKITGIRRPRDWSLMYLTPVTVLRTRGIIGTSVTSEATMAAPTKAKIIQRVAEQELRFAWPSGADEVRVYVGPRGPAAADGLTQSAEPIQRITKHEFERTGMTRLKLSPNGVSVVLRSGKNLAGRYVEGHPLILDYPGILRFQYSASIKGGVFRKPTAEVSVWVDQSEGVKSTFSGRPYFMAVHNDDRLPLHADDGIPLVMEPKDGGGAAAARFQPASVLNAPGLETWVGKIGSKTGYVRLFVAESPELLKRMALLDPPVGKLKVG